MTTYTAAIATDSSATVGDFCDVAVIENVVRGYSVDDDGKENPDYAMGDTVAMPSIELPSCVNDLDQVVEEATPILNANGWHITSGWTIADTAFYARVERGPAAGTIFLYEDNGGGLHAQRDNGPIWHLGGCPSLTGPDPGGFPRDAATWLAGMWEPGENNGQHTDGHADPAEGDTLVAAWDGMLKLERGQTGAPVAGGAASAYLGLTVSAERKTEIAAQMRGYFQRHDQHIADGQDVDCGCNPFQDVICDLPEYDPEDPRNTAVAEHLNEFYLMDGTLIEETGTGTWRIDGEAVG